MICKAPALEQSPNVKRTYCLCSLDGSTSWCQTRGNPKKDGKESRW